MLFSNTNIAEIIGRVVARSHLNPLLKIFLFGINGKDELKYGNPAALRDYYILQSSLQEDKTREHIDYKAIHEKIVSWQKDKTNLMKKVSLDSLSEELGISKKALARYFENYLNEDFRIWKNRQRIELAKSKIIENPQKDIAEIAIELGYQDKSNFHRQFKFMTGYTPGQWKRTDGHPEDLQYD